jgi:4-hydroxy-tetrahydrodipicolinate synthase
MMSDMVRHALSGDYASAQKLLFELNEINPLMYKESSPVGVKETLALMGYVENHVRLPLVKGSDGLRKKISAFLNR